MTDGLTARQTQILKSLIDEYLETAEPVGSLSLDKKFNLGISPATIRNEMMALTKMGYLKQPHTSAGRIPTPVAMKFYISQLMEEKQMSLADEVKAKEEVSEAKGSLDDLLEEATQALAQRTRSLSVAALNDDEKVWHAGYANLFHNPEFSDLGICENIFGLLEEAQRIHQLFFGRQVVSPIEVIFGEELDWPDLRPIGVVATHFKAKGREGVLGVIGPARIAYPTVIPTLRYFGNLIEEIAGK